MGFLDDLWEGVQDVGGAIARGAGGIAGQVISQAPGFILEEVFGQPQAGPVFRTTPPIAGGAGPFIPTTQPFQQQFGTSGLPGGVLPPTSVQQAGILPELPAFVGEALQTGAEALLGGTPAGAFLGIGEQPVAIPSVRGLATITPQMRTSSRLPSVVQFAVPTPSGGTRLVTYKNMGRPILYSGDLAAVRRVRRVAARAKRRVGGR